MISVYIHIPFCNQICTYCDFCKLYKDDKWVDDYLKELKKEIKTYYQKEEVKTLYFGGGTPSSLNIKELTKLFEIIKLFNLSKNAEITFECNVEDLTEEKLLFLKDKVNRLSIGVQSFDEKILRLLGRQRVNIENIELAKKYFKNINIDLMYGFNEQSLTNLKNDLAKYLELDIPHISAYSLILEPHTKLYIDGYEINNDDTLFDELIETTLANNGYNHYEISNYAQKGYESNHNLVYWDNEHYYGFGLGASGYINNKRYENTHNIDKYLQGNYIKEQHNLDLDETISNEFILGFRKLKGINKLNFKQKYNLDILEIKELKAAIEDELIIDDGVNVFINPKYIYISNEILLKFINISLPKQKFVI